MKVEHDYVVLVPCGCSFCCVPRPAQASVGRGSEPAVQEDVSEPAAQESVDVSEPAAQERVDVSEPAAQERVDVSEPTAQESTIDEQTQAACK